MNRWLVTALSVCCAFSSFAQAPVQTQRPDVLIGLTNLETMHKKGLLSDQEYQEAMRDLAEIGERAASATTLTIPGGVAFTPYGFVEGDIIHDDTQSFVDLAGMGGITLPGSIAGDNGRTMFSARNSRLGFRLKGPEVGPFRPSAMLESDFLGNQPGTPPNDSSTPYKESSFFNNPSFRIRHYLVRFDNDYVNVWIGQYWGLVGWQGGDFFPNTTSYQGIPGELYVRTPQLRLDKQLKLGPVTVEVAAAALRPPQMDAQMPDFQAGLLVKMDSWQGWASSGQTGGRPAPAQIGISGGIRRFALSNGWGKEQESVAVGKVGAVDVMLPIIPKPDKDNHAWALTVTAEGSIGTGDNDLFTGFSSGGAGLGAPGGYVAPTTGTCSGVANSATAPGSYAACQGDIDPGFVGWTSAGVLQTVDWNSLNLGAQLYLPPSGKVWLAATYTNTVSDNALLFGAAGKVWWHEVYYTFDVFAQPHPNVRFGASYQTFVQTFGTGQQATNHRLQLTGWFLFG